MLSKINSGSVPACRTYFKLNDGLTIGDIDMNNSVKAYNINFEEETSAIKEELRVEPEISADEWYDLSGRKLGCKPNKAGVYIHNGKNILVY